MNFNFMGNRYTFLAISAILILLSLGLMLVKGLRYGIDFQGGSILHIRFDKEITEGNIRDIFSKMPNLYFTADQVVIQPVAEGNGREFIIQYPATLVDDQASTETHSAIMRQLKAAAPFSDEALETANIGPTLGGEMKRQGVRAAVFSVIGILLYLAWRFEFNSAAGAVLALVHDLCITLGFVCLTGMEFDITVLAACLTMLGYSVNDTIVVFDRIRENRKLLRETNFTNLINDSINATMSRTINTSATTLFTLIALIVVGGSSIQGFARTLTFGIAIGTYSSIFIASPILLYLTGEKLDRRRA